MTGKLNHAIVPASGNSGTPTRGQTSYSFGPFQFSAEMGMLSNQGQLVHLGSRTAALLALLVERSGELVTKNELIAAAWPDVSVDESNLRVSIAALRRVLNDSTRAPEYIINVAGRGYRFVAPVAANLRDQSEAVTSSAAAPTRLPTLDSEVFGREHDIKSAVALLEDFRSVTLIGPGGVGKTTTALAIAHQIKNRFADNACFVDLAAVTDPEVVPFAIATATGVAIETHRSVESLVQRLQAQDILLILDNCEHLIDAVATVAEALLKGALGVRIVATSHEVLRIEGERAYHISPLSVPNWSDAPSVSTLMANAAARLFVEHVGRHVPGFAPDDADVPFIVEICQRLDGLPLAIEIAAAQAGKLGLVELAERLDDRFAVLKRDRQDVAPRHRTLLSVLDWAHAGLGERERIVMRRLAVFVGGFSVEAATSVAGDETLNASAVMTALSNLASRSLLTTTTKDGSSWFRMLDSTRLYALEKLNASGELERVRVLYSHFLCEVLRESERSWSNTPVQKWLRAYSRYLDDIRSNLKRCFADGGDKAAGIELTSLAMPLASLMGLHSEFYDYMASALAEASRLVPPLVVPELRIQVARNAFTYHVGQPLEVDFERARALAEMSGKDRHRIEPLVQMAATLSSLGEYERSVETAAKALEVARRSGDEFAVLSASRVMSHVAHYAGQHDVAMEHAIRVLLHPVINIPATYGFLHTDRRVSMRWVLMRSLWLSGRGDEAVQVAEDVLEIAPDAGSVAMAQSLAMAIIPIYLWRGDLDVGQRLTDKLSEHSRRFSFRYWESWARLYHQAIESMRHGGQLTPVEGEMQQEALSTLVGTAAPLPEKYNGYSWSTPEIKRLQGEQMLLEGHVENAISRIEEGLKLAAAQRALAWELRCATSICRIRSLEGRDASAMAKLQSVLHRIKQGEATRDIVAARELLEQIG